MTVVEPAWPAADMHDSLQHPLGAFTLQSPSAFLAE